MPESFDSSEPSQLIDSNNAQVDHDQMGADIADWTKARFLLDQLVATTIQF